MKRNVEVKERTIKEEIITYVSADGRTFNSEEECKKWESSYEHTIIMGMKQIPQVSFDEMEDWLPYTNDMHYIYVFKPQTMEDIVTMNAYDELFHNGSTSVDAKFTANDIGTVITLSIPEYQYEEAIGHDAYTWLNWLRMSKWIDKVDALCHEAEQKIDNQYGTGEKKND